MLRVYRQGFPNRMTPAEFESRYGALLLAPVANAGAATDEEKQKEEEYQAAKKAGRGGALLILRRANLHELRHYQFGKTPPRLRTGD